MTRTVRMITLAASALAIAACAESITGSSGNDLLDAAFLTTPVGFESAASSFAAGNGPMGDAFMPGMRGGHRGPNGLGDGLGGGHDFMGGGFHDDFLGGPIGGGRPFDHGGFSSSSTCTFAATTGVVTCAPETHNGITVNKTVIYKNAAGAAQAAQDSTTNSVQTHVVVSGTMTRRDSNVTTVSSTSDRTVTGLTSTATQRTVNGTSGGTESTTGKDTVGTFTVARVIGDTTSGIIIPITNGKPTYPTAGTVIRSMKATLTYSGKAPTVSTRREVVTYDGSATAKLVITQDGTVKNCTIALPHGRPACS
ncbi:MAG: hypothetical protein V4550_15710 [Gemmatimonadota bacterium]